LHLFNIARSSKTQNGCDNLMLLAHRRSPVQRRRQFLGASQASVTALSIMCRSKN